jgi:hypothetical protein
MIDFPNDYGLFRRDFAIGTIYFNNNYVITNFKEGIDIDYNSFKDVGNFIKSHFNGREFGYIANRENSYSINLKDAEVFNKAFPNLKAYAIVIYNTFTGRIFEIENHFFPHNRKAFKKIDDAVNWVSDTLN